VFDPLLPHLLVRPGILRWVAARAGQRPARLVSVQVVTHRVGGADRLLAHERHGSRRGRPVKRSLAGAETGPAAAAVTPAAVAFNFYVRLGELTSDRGTTYQNKLANKLHGVLLTVCENATGAECNRWVRAFPVLPVPFAQVLVRALVRIAFDKVRNPLQGLAAENSVPGPVVHTIKNQLARHGRLGSSVVMAVQGRQGLGPRGEQERQGSLSGHRQAQVAVSVVEDRPSGMVGTSLRAIGLDVPNHPGP